MAERNTLTTAFGIPVPDNQNSLTSGPRGPVLLQDVYLLEKLAHFNRERIPERVVHAKGAGAYGYFEVTHDLTRYCKAALFARVGKRTETVVRFSTVAGEKGSADAERDPRGFAVRFYTEDGNYDLVMNNTPVFFIRDPLKFPDFIHTQKRHPETNCKDPNAHWDFISLSPESLHQITILFSDRGTPRTYRHMHGFSGHTFLWVNAAGEGSWVKYHFRTETGIDNFSREEAIDMAGRDPDHATRDLFATIAAGGHAAWSVEVQIMPAADAATYRFDVFDLTKVWPHRDYPRQKLGRLVLDRNPQNYFAEIEQAAFSPGNLVPGIQPSFDKMLQARLISYSDAHRYRLGVNYVDLPVNCPHATKASNYYRDGAMKFNGNNGGCPVYEPNSYADAPKQAPEHAAAPFDLQGPADRTPYTHPNDHYTQPGNLYRLLSEPAKQRLVHNLVEHLKLARRVLQERQLTHFHRADPDYARRIAVRLGLDPISTQTASTLVTA
ncbi:MAG TPA: catalase [Thermoanaerobaculia bacterium]|nr:catalase [Thermoanaerobaculia bacterium]